jgi:hypothetical protein
MDSWKSGNLYEALLSMDAHQNTAHEKPHAPQKRSMVKLVVPIKTYRDELQDRYQENERRYNDQRHDQRAEGYNTLCNKTELGANLEKTRMCNSVEKNVTCRHGERCRFAHSLEELVTRNCFFKDECRFVRFENGKLVNNGRDTCRNKHPHESKDEFMERVGLTTRKSTHASTHVPTHVPTHVQGHFQTPKVVALEKSMHTTPASSWVSTLKASLKPAEEAPSSSTLPLAENSLEKKKEVVLRVPRELVMQALELAIKSGNTSIRVEVVE